MMYDPASLLAELEDYQKYAEEAFEDGLVEDLSRFPDGAKRARDQKLMAPDSIVIDTIDDILPLSFEIEGITYRLSSVNSGRAKYKG